MPTAAGPQHFSFGQKKTATNDSPEPSNSLLIIKNSQIYWCETLLYLNNIKHQVKHQHHHLHISLFTEHREESIRIIFFQVSHCLHPWIGHFSGQTDNWNLYSFESNEICLGLWLFFRLSFSLSLSPSPTILEQRAVQNIWPSLPLYILFNYKQTNQTIARIRLEESKILNEFQWGKEKERGWLGQFRPKQQTKKNPNLLSFEEFGKFVWNYRPHTVSVTGILFFSNSFLPPTKPPPPNFLQSVTTDRKRIINLLTNVGGRQYFLELERKFPKNTEIRI